MISPVKKPTRGGLVMLNDKASCGDIVIGDDNRRE